MALPRRAITAAMILLLLLAGCGEGGQTAAPIQPRDTPAPPAVTPTAFPEDTQVRAADGMTMILVPGGTFPMGSTEAEIEDAIALCAQHYGICNRWYYEREGPQHPVILDDFSIDQTEVTNAQYRRCVEAGACSEPLACAKGEPTHADPNRADHPVVCVSWDETRTYCAWAGGSWN
jgi:sulfatase modifying factor 1